MPSVQHFIVVNSLFLLTGSIQYYIFQNTPYLLYFFFLLQDLTFPLYLNKREEVIRPSLRNTWQISLMNTGSLYLSSLVARNHSSLTNELLFFIPYSLCFEVFFDFFHYATHYLFHKVPFLYKHIHSRHHRSRNINVNTAFDHNLTDLLFTNTLPILLTSYLLSPSKYFLCVWFVYKIIQEIYGHNGVRTRSSCFPQCIWLPRLLHIELYCVDHAVHHKNPAANFGKRFTLWDKVFGTYVASNQIS